MSRFSNGGIPASLLVEIGPYHWMTAATAKRWAGLVADILKNEGVRMQITPGKNAYRDYAGQVFARNGACANGRCDDAAVAGTSSHGGEYRGRDSLAIDVANWGVLGKDKWYAYCRKHGFEPGFFDWEPWHIIDWAPWTMPAGPSGGSTTPATKPEVPEEEEEEEEDEDMAMKGLSYRRASDNALVIATFNEISGFYSEVQDTTGEYNTPIAQAWEVRGAEANNGSWPALSESHVNALKRDLALVRAGK